jgi:hypothetical protein
MHECGCGYESVALCARIRNVKAGTTERDVGVYRENATGKAG